MREMFPLRVRIKAECADDEEAETLAKEIEAIIKNFPQCSEVQAFVYVEDGEYEKSLLEQAGELEAWFRQKYAKEIAEADGEAEVLASLVEECFAEDAERHNSGGLNMQFHYLLDFYEGVEEAKKGIDTYFFRL
jgi:hypothetical protein